MKAGPYVGWSLAIIPGKVILWSWMLCIIWSWFIVEQFRVAPLTLHSACGLQLVGSILTGKDSGTVKKTDEERKEAFTVSVANAFVIPFITLGIAFVFHKMLG